MTKETPVPQSGTFDGSDLPDIEIVPFPEPPNSVSPPPSEPVEPVSPPPVPSTPLPRSGRRGLSILLPVAIVGALTVALVATIIGLAGRSGDDAVIDEIDIAGSQQTTAAPGKDPAVTSTVAPSTTATPVATTTTTPSTSAPTTTAPTVAVPAGWIRFSAADGSFSASLPAEPVESVETWLSPAGPAPRHEYVVPLLGDRSLVIDVTRNAVPPGMSVEAFLRFIAADVGHALGGSIGEPTFAVEGTRHYLDFVVAYDGALMTARGIVVGTTFHLVTVSAAQPDPATDDTAEVTAGLFNTYAANI